MKKWPVMDSEREESLGEGGGRLPADVRYYLRRQYEVPPGPLAEAKARFGVRPGASAARLVYDSAAMSDDLENDSLGAARTLRFMVGPSEIEFSVYLSNDQCSVVVRSTATVVRAYLERPDVVVELDDGQGEFICSSVPSGDVRLWVEMARPPTRARTDWICLVPPQVVDDRRLTERR
jgi:hypothetical protein